jgi:hypothetical protein
MSCGLRYNFSRKKVRPCRLLFRVKGGKSQSEQIFSALHQKAVTYASATASTGLRLCRRACRGEIVEEGEEVIAVTDCRVKSALCPICRTSPKKSAALSFTAVWIGTIAICFTSRSPCSEISHHALRPTRRRVASESSTGLNDRKPRGRFCRPKQRNGELQLRLVMGGTGVAELRR